MSVRTPIILDGVGLHNARDMAPTLLHLRNLAIPAEMDGQSLLLD